MTSSVSIFAYGSNMWSVRMVRRVASAQTLGIGTLANMSLKFNKIGSVDRSGKANLVPSEYDQVYGVIYSIDQGEVPILDAIERGYRREAFCVRDNRGEEILVQAYLSDLVHPSILPTAKYKKYVLDGALEHGLPMCYIQRLTRVPAAAG